MVHTQQTNRDACPDLAARQKCKAGIVRWINKTNAVGLGRLRQKRSLLGSQVPYAEFSPLICHSE
jgi:hypothetical protein